jgi:hypothetical protein
LTCADARFTVMVFPSYHRNEMELGHGVGGEDP